MTRLAPHIVKAIDRGAGGVIGMVTSYCDDCQRVSKATVSPSFPKVAS